LDCIGTKDGFSYEIEKRRKKITRKGKIKRQTKELTENHTLIKG
jgi:hypothetical protein